MKNSVSITDSTFFNNATAAGIFNLSYLTLSNSGNSNSDIGYGKRGFVMQGGTGRNTTWPADGLPYIISGGYTVNYGHTLTVSPGAVVKFENNSAYIQVGGTLTAVGVSTYPIYFTSIKDDILNNTDATSTSPAAGDWKHITVSSGVVNLEYATIRYGGGDYYAANLINNSGTYHIASSTISNGYSYGIWHQSGTTNLTQSSLFGFGIEAYHNPSYATTTATNNYWGSLDGPYNPKYNPNGNQNSAVSDYVTFWPWLGQTHYLNSTNSVDGGKSMHWEYDAGSTQQFSTQLEYGIGTWNALGGVNIAPYVWWQNILDLTIYEVDDVNKAVAAYWGAYDKIEYNKYYMNDYSSSLKQMIVTHELGHALGLHHSYVGNIMIFTGTSQTSLGTQDIGDYTYCWIDDNCEGQN
ncbi:MAG: M43 family zinc metalloprotease [Candidatus Paceibacterota bacterium]|jgi:hypothetical protein|nr:M43 family zinc metalloprotease [Candidatus Paceibacterota bacterium]